MDSDLIAFVACVDQDTEIQALVGAAATPQEILDLAASRAFVVELDALRQASRELSAPYWPWAAKGTVWRRQFFADV